MTKQVSLQSIDFSVSPGVYEPREDSFLLAENTAFKPGSFVLDVGCGSGIQGINAALLGAGKVLCTDVSREALQCTIKNAEAMGLKKKITVRESDLFERVHESFDCIIFNPPYVPSGQRKYLDVDGGCKGREILDRFLLEFPGHLNKQGHCFFLQSSLNGKSKTVRAIKEQGIGCEIVASQRLFFEEIMVFKCFKQ